MSKFNRNQYGFRKNLPTLKKMRLGGPRTPANFTSTGLTSTGIKNTDFVDVPNSAPINNPIAEPIITSKPAAPRTPSTRPPARFPVTPTNTVNKDTLDLSNNPLDPNINIPTRGIQNAVDPINANTGSGITNPTKDIDIESIINNNKDLYSRYSDLLNNKYDNLTSQYDDLLTSFRAFQSSTSDQINNINNNDYSDLLNEFKTIQEQNSASQKELYDNLLNQFTELQTSLTADDKKETTYVPEITYINPAYRSTFKYGGKMPFGGTMPYTTNNSKLPVIQNYKGANHNNGGIPVDENGNPSVVSGKSPIVETEGNELSWNDYVFSDKIDYKPTTYGKKK